MNNRMQSSAIDNLLTSLKRRMAREQNIQGYLDSIKKFCEFAETEPDQIVNSAKAGKVSLTDLLQKFVDQMLNEGLAPKTIRRTYYQVQKFFRANKVKIEHRSVELPIARVIYEDRAIEKEEIKLLLKTGDLRQRWLVLLLPSSGVRIGSVPNLQLKHLEEWKKESVTEPVKLTIPSEYAKDYQGYTTFITPEAYEALQDYLNLRRKFGENINEESYLVRDKFTAKPNGANNPKPLSLAGLNTVMKRMMATYIRKKKRKRHPFKESHGFRKFFRTALDSAGLPTGSIESLMGHSSGLITIYTKYSDEALKELYARAIPNLTIEKVVISEVERRKQSMWDNAQMLYKNEPEKLELLKQLLAHATTMEDVDRIPEEIHRRTELEPIRRESGYGTEEDCQKIVTEEELLEYLKRQWHVVCVLPSGKIVVSNE